LTLHSFGPDNFVSLIEIGKFQKRLIEENENYKMVYYTKTKTARTYAPTQYVEVIIVFIVYNKIN
jgi:hypothetical protein